MKISNTVPNRLIKEKSPYLLQHAHNPVDWFPWSEEAFNKAKVEDKPIFLSIGYSTCHWCHVMERESFEDEEVAKVLNNNYIAIKVDREERPDLDQLYMTFCQVLTGQGGWPLTVILTPEKKPFFAGTYFPKHSRGGLAGLVELLTKLAALWSSQRDKLISTGEELTAFVIKESLEFNAGDLSVNVIDDVYHSLEHYFDPEYGGFGHAPKFPTPHQLTFLLRYYTAKGEEKALEMVEKTLEQMYKGGIFDHVGYGFSRYSTDKKWLVPHFEKMLYDNALLAIAYLEAYQVTGKGLYREIAEKIFSYILREMASPEGAFYSAEDADSEGVEGKFYLWTPEEIKKMLGENTGGKFCSVYDITKQGNFAGSNIPNLLNSEYGDLEKIEYDFAEERVRLYQARNRRVHPFKDDKILTAWNGLMITALALGGRILDNGPYLAAAEKALNFILDKLISAEGRLLARYRHGEVAYLAYLDDYAFLIWALLELYASTYKPEYLKKALALNKEMLDLFWDEKQKCLYLTGKDSEKILVRPKEIYDGALPAGASVAILNLLKLANLTGEYELEKKAQEFFYSCGEKIKVNPMGYTYLLQAYLFSQTPVTTLVIVAGEDNEKRNVGHMKDNPEMLALLKKTFLPHTVSLYLSGETRELTGVIPFLADYQAVERKTTAYFCQNKKCKAPIQELATFKKTLLDYCSKSAF